MRSPGPTRRDHDQFCRTEGWKEVRNARGGTVRHHITYELELSSGGMLRTRISRPVSDDGYGPALWSHILRDQLQVDEAAFWACVRHGTVPDRGGGIARPSEGALPAELVHLLIHRLGVPATEVAAMSKDEAVTRLNRHWTQHNS